MADGQQVGSIYYDVELNTAGMLEGERRIRSSINVLDRDITKLNLKIKPLGANITALFAVMAAGSIPVAIMADNFRLLEARVNIAAGSMQLGKAAFEQIYQISRDTNTSLEANVAVFTRLNQSMLQMGGTQQDTIRLTELLSKATMASGASAQEASASMQQFGQALGSGVLQGDELRSILENNAKLAMALAEGLGVPVGALKKLGEQGKLTSDVVVKALGNAAASIERDFAQIPQTLEKTAGSAVDALSKLTYELDEQAGVSATLTGITDGLGKSFDLLSNSIDDVDQETANLQRKDAIKKWSDRAVVGMSYLADAADKTWQTLSVLGRNVSFVFESIGKEIGGRAAQAKAFFSGEFEMAGKIGADMAADSAARRAALDKADEESLKARKSWGQQMREEWTKGAGAPKGGIGPVQPLGTGLKSTATGDDKKNRTTPKFDSQGYINDLVIANADGLAKIDAQEKAKQADNDRLLAEGKISYQKYQQAQVLIAAAAEKDRADLRAKEKADTDQWLKEMYAIGEQAAKEAADRAAQSRQAGEDIQRLGMTPEQQAQFDVVTQARDQLEELDALRQENIITQEQYAQAEIDINRSKVDEIRALEMGSQQARLQAASSFFGEAASLLESYGDNSSNTYKNLFRISKAFALADSLVSLQAAIMKASVSAPFPANLATMAAMGSAGLSVISNLRGVTFGGGRQYGGAVSAGSLYRVNETGAPEMFTASNGRQYMMPNTKGEVTAANKLGGGGGDVIIHNYAGADVSATQNQNGDTEVIINRAVSEVASQIASNNGQVWSALRGGSNIQPKL